MLTEVEENVIEDDTGIEEIKELLQVFRYLATLIDRLIWKWKG